MLTIKAEKRDIFGKKLKSMRQNDRLPAVFYGKKDKSQPIFVPMKAFQKIFKEAGETSVIELQLAHNKKNVLIHDIDFDPLSGLPVHADFLVVDMDKPITASVPLIFVGESDAVKSLGGILVKILHEIEVEALPANLPHQLEADISKLKTMEDKISVADIKLPTGVKILERTPDEVVALVELPAEEKIEEEIDFEKIEASAEKKKEEAKEAAEEGKEEKKEEKFEKKEE